jgi:hypothetical protein
LSGLEAPWRVNSIPIALGREKGTLIPFGPVFLSDNVKAMGSPGWYGPFWNGVSDIARSGECSIDAEFADTKTAIAASAIVTFILTSL